MKIALRVSGVYCWHNLVNNKVYVGSSAACLATRKARYLIVLPRNRCHNRYLQNAWNKYGAENFRFVVLERCPAEQCLAREQYWMDHYSSYERAYGYNLSPTAGSPQGYKHTEETRARMSASGKGRKFTAEHKAKIGAANRGKVRSPEARLHNQTVRKGKPVSAEALANIRAANNRPEWKAKQSAARKGKKLSAEHRAKISAASLGKKKPPEFGPKIAAAHKRRREVKARLASTESRLQSTSPMQD